MRRLLIANRGEIARRIQLSAHAMGIECIAVFAEPDRAMPFVHEADAALPIGSYLDSAALIAAAQRAHADAIHPGYGFLSENAAFAQACLDAGLTFVGPPPEAMRAMADKLEAKRIASAAGVPVLPSLEPGDDFEYPVLIKAAAGGGGRGMRRVDSAAALEEALASARREAAASFGDETVFLEPCLDSARHVEVQVLGDQHGCRVHVFDRDCSIQRRHQKLIEEAPAPWLAPGVRARLFEAALALANAIEYSSAGSVEFLVKGEQIVFLEMNTRLQVEHPVTEAITGLDLVRLQLEIACGRPLPFTQQGLTATGHAIEARLYAEDPAQAFQPSVGRVHRFHPDDTPLRWDSGVDSGSEISPLFEGLLAKAVAHAATREEASARLGRGLRGLAVHGVQTNRDALVAVLESATFGAAELATDFLARQPDLLTVGPPPDIVRVHALAAALVLRERRLRARQTLRFVPPGWRNTPVAPPDLQLGGHRISPESGCVDGVEVASRVHGVADERIDLEVDGVLGRYTVYSYGTEHYVNGRGWQTRLDDAPRFAETTDTAAATGPTAPLPGTVVAVLVEPGDRVRGGQPLVILDAMKIEHAVAASADGTVSEVRVKAGQRVDAHDVLIVLGP
jgi:propionyl-CoA carboxylase alpha chain